MERRRILVPAVQGTSDVIVFHCSHCGWEYDVKRRQSFLIDYNDADRACRAFEEHRCFEHGVRPDCGAPETT